MGQNELDHLRRDAEAAIRETEIAEGWDAKAAGLAAVARTKLYAAELVNTRLTEMNGFLETIAGTLDRLEGGR